MQTEVIITGTFERPDENDFSGVAIPLEVTRSSGVTVIRACSELKEIALRFASLFDCELFSSEAGKWLDLAVAPFIDNESLCRSDECGRMIIFEFFGRNSAETRIISVETLLYKADAGYENLTSFDLDLIAELEMPAFVVISDDKVVSAAVGSSCGDGMNQSEVGVETADGYGGRGFATACVRSLALELRERGKAALYIAQEDNPASISVAKNAGFEETGRLLQIICREKDL
jgi:Predicted acetyltransferase